MSLKRIYVICREHRTTISVDDQLYSYMLRRTAGGKPVTDFTHTKVRKWVQLLLDVAGDSLPETGISQWVQGHMLDAIADPALKDDEKIAAEQDLDRRKEKLLNEYGVKAEVYKRECASYDRRMAAAIERVGKRPRLNLRPKRST